MNSKLTPEMRAYFAVQGRKGGRVAPSAIKREAGRKGGYAKRAREKALQTSHAELLTIGREIGAWLDDLKLTGKDEDRRKELSDRLYAALTVAKVRV